jgi:hypothetical protein
VHANKSDRPAGRCRSALLAIAFKVGVGAQRHGALEVRRSSARRLYLDFPGFLPLRLACLDLPCPPGLALAARLVSPKQVPRWCFQRTTSRFDHFIRSLHLIFLLQHLEKIPPTSISEPATLPPSRPVDCDESPGILRLVAAARHARMKEKEFLDSDRVNFLIWRFVARPQSHLTHAPSVRCPSTTTDSYFMNTC